MTNWTSVKSHFIILPLALTISLSYAQKTITKKNYAGKSYEQYQVDANGTNHGFYKRFFKNGFLETDAVYYKGVQISCKRYEYYGATRYLMSDMTWDRKGKILTSKSRMYMDGEVGPLKQSAGLLVNGKGRWTLEIYSNYSNEYSEQYNSNDTVYVWKDKTKSSKVRKFIGDNEVHSKAQLALDEQLQQAWICVQEKVYTENTKTSNKDYYTAIEKYYADKEYNFYVDIAKILADGTEETLRSKIKALMCINDIDFSRSPLEINVGEYGGLTVSVGKSSYELFKYTTNQTKLELILDIHNSKQ